MSKNSTQPWLGPAMKRHGWHVVAASAAVMALYWWKDDPDLILIGATAVFVSGVVAWAVEGIRAAWHAPTE